MPSIAVPVCSSCSFSTENSISCSECSQICCSICINRPTNLIAKSINIVQLCPKCFNINGLQQKLDTAKIGQDEEHCNVHGKSIDQFCLDCSICVCGDCANGKLHGKHSIESLIAVHQESLADVEQKLAIAEKNLTGFAYETHLAELENAAKSIEQSVITMTKNAIFDLKNSAALRKATLKTEMNANVDKRDCLSQLQKTAENLSMKDLLAKQLELNQLFDNIITECTHKYDSQTVDDLECDLIPSYTFTELTCPEFTETTSTFETEINSAHNVSWKVTFINHLDVLHVELEPTDIAITKFVHKLIVIVLNPIHPRKEIQKTFDLREELQSFYIEELSYFAEHKFYTKAGIRIKIGVRPLDVVVEKNLLNYNYKTMKAAQSTLEHACSIIHAGQASIVMENRNLNNQLDFVRYVDQYCISYFSCNLRMLKSNHNGTQFSSCICDVAGRMWVLKVVLSAPCLAGTHIGAFVQLSKGKPTRCNVFIELKHNEPQETVLERKTFDYDEGMCFGWKNIVTWTKIVTGGYHKDGILRFRYGVQPLLD